MKQSLESPKTMGHLDHQLEETHPSPDACQSILPWSRCFPKHRGQKRAVFPNRVLEESRKSPARRKHCHNTLMSQPHAAFHRGK